MYDSVKQPSSGKRILVVRLGAMGDIIHALPAVASLKQSFPGSHLTWIVEPQWASLLDGNPFVDRVALLRRDGPAAIIRSCRELRSSRFDLVVDFQGLVKSAVVCSVAHADCIFGFHQSQVRERAAAFVYSDKVLSQSVHVVDRNLDLAQSAGAGALVKTFPLPQGSPQALLPEAPFVLASPM